jgi:hypothetical protein
MIEEAERQALHARLEASRRGLLAALEGVTERDFASDLGGETVVQLLARLAAEERTAIAAAGGPATTERQVEKPLPPQVVHALAGARYRTLRYLEAPEADPILARTLVEGIEGREAEAARRVRERPALPAVAAPPAIPVLPPQPPHG